MLRSIHATTRPKRRLKRREVSRSFRIRPEVDRALDKEAAKKGWTKSFLIRDIIHSWFTYRTARAKIELSEFANQDKIKEGDE